MTVGAVKGVEVGGGFQLARLRGSASNDNMTDGGFLSNNHGGVLGGMSTGEPVVLRLAVKPTSSISQPQKTIDIHGMNRDIEVHGPPRPVHRDSGRARGGEHGGPGRARRVGDPGAAAARLDPALRVGGPRLRESRAMQAEILMIGTELLLGQVLDTNAAYMGRLLAEHGINLYQKTTVGDNKGRIVAALDAALRRSDVVLCSGGLGPTEDDITRECVAELLGRPLEYHEDLWETVKARFTRSRIQFTENNKRQAMLPQGAHAIENPHGTAPGVLVDDPRGVIACMPGVPGELKPMLEERVIPFLRARFGLAGALVYKVLKVCGMGESRVDSLIGDLVASLDNPTVGLLASPGGRAHTDRGAGRGRGVGAGAHRAGGGSGARAPARAGDGRRRRHAGGGGKRPARGPELASGRGRDLQRGRRRAGPRGHGIRRLCRGQDRSGVRRRGRPAAARH